MRFGKYVAAFVWIGLFLGPLAPSNAQSPKQAKQAGKLEDFVPGYSVARCLFDEGRLVLEHEERFIVLRKGDILPGQPRIRLIEIGGTQAVLAEARVGVSEAGVGVPQRLIKIVESREGALSVILLTAEVQRRMDAEVVESAVEAVEESAESKKSGGRRP